MGKNSLPNKWCQETWTAKEWNWTTIIHNTQKLDLNLRLQSIKLLEENIGNKLLNICPGNDFLDVMQKAKATKAEINNWDYIKLKTCTAKGTINKIKGSLLNGGKYLQIIHLVRG